MVINMRMNERMIAAPYLRHTGYKVRHGIQAAIDPFLNNFDFFISLQVILLEILVSRSIVFNISLDKLVTFIYKYY